MTLVSLSHVIAPSPFPHSICWCNIGNYITVCVYFEAIDLNTGASPHHTPTHVTCFDRRICYYGFWLTDVSSAVHVQHRLVFKTQTYQTIYTSPRLKRNRLKMTLTLMLTPHNVFHWHHTVSLTNSLQMFTTHPLYILTCNRSKCDAEYVLK